MASTCRFIADCNVQIEELELSVRNASFEPINSLLYHIWKLVPPDVMYVISFTRLPLALFSRATLKRLGSLGTRLRLKHMFTFHMFPPQPNKSTPEF